MKTCKHRNGNYNCGSYAFNLHSQGIDQGDLCDVHYYKQQRDELLAAIKQTLDDNAHLADGDVCTLRVLRDAYNEVSEVKW